MESLNMDEIIAKAIARAEAWQDRANELLTAEEKAIQEQMQSLLNNPVDKVVLAKMIDQSFRSHNPARVADQISYILHEFGVPDFFSRTERLLIQMFMGVGRYFPAFTVPRVVERMRQSSSRAIIPGEEESLHAHLHKRKIQGVRMNINHLGEAVLGEGEALRRLETLIRDLQNPEIEYISVKMSTIYSQINSLAFEHTLSLLQERLSRLYRRARENHYTRRDQSVAPKLVNLDMEEYRDLEITCQAFVRTLEQEEFKNYSAGMVLQSYLPDSFEIQKELTAWARKRAAAGGAPIKLRIVKVISMDTGIAMATNIELTNPNEKMIQTTTRTRPLMMLFWSSD
ncbi:MAG: proline dehydrogenase family protein, partial [Pseudomonadota bacterium]